MLNPRPAQLSTCFWVMGLGVASNVLVGLGVASSVLVGPGVASSVLVGLKCGL